MRLDEPAAGKAPCSAQALAALALRFLLAARSFAHAGVDIVRARRLPSLTGGIGLLAARAVGGRTIGANDAPLRRRRAARFDRNDAGEQRRQRNEVYRLAWFR